MVGGVGGGFSSGVDYDKLPGGVRGGCGSAGAVDLSWEEVWSISPTGELWPVQALYDAKRAGIPVPAVMVDSYFGPALARLVEAHLGATRADTLPQEKGSGGGEPEPIRELAGIPGLGVSEPGPPVGVPLGSVRWSTTRGRGPRRFAVTWPGVCATASIAGVVVLPPRPRPV